MNHAIKTLNTELAILDEILTTEKLSQRQHDDLMKRISDLTNAIRVLTIKK